jgi:hypothetical protein
MFRTHLLSQAVRLILTPHRDLDDRIDAGAFYIGLGDQFDDDRRRVRALVPALRPARRPTSAGVSSPAILADSWFAARIE